MTEHETEVFERMQKYGGSFVKALAAAAFCADRSNLDKIITTFSDYWKQYEEMVEAE